MKSLLITAAVVLISTSTVAASEIQANIEEINGQTVITCEPNQEGEIERAYFTLYQSDSDQLSVLRQEMEISADNKATYSLPGVHDVIGGICKFIMSDSNPKITRGDFLVSMK